MADVAHIIASLRKMAEHAVHGASYDQVARAAPMLAEAADTMETLRARVEALEAMVPKKSRKRREAFPPGLDLHLFAEIKAACLRLGRREWHVNPVSGGVDIDVGECCVSIDGNGGAIGGGFDPGGSADLTELARLVAVADAARR